MADSGRFDVSVMIYNVNLGLDEFAVFFFYDALKVSLKARFKALKFTENFGAVLDKRKNATRCRQFQLFERV